MFSRHDQRIFSSLWPSLAACLLCLSSAAQETTATAPTEAPLVLHVSVREVVLDVIALDNHNHSVNDLTESEFQVFEPSKQGDTGPRQILSLHIIDPIRDASHAGATESGIRISSGAVCALNSTIHYELTIAASPEPGYHQVVVKTTRPHVTLSFRQRYYVGQVSQASQDKDHKAKADPAAVEQAACFHSLTPATLALAVHSVVLPGQALTRFAVAVRPESIAAIGLDGSSSRVQLDFGMCTFDTTGKPARYQRYPPIDLQLSAAQLELAQTRGVGITLQIPGAEAPYLARIAVRDRQSGNLGVVDVARPVSLAEEAGNIKALKPAADSLSSFGTVTPREGAFCGDVYELSPSNNGLPDFWNLEPVSSIYTDTLNVPNQLTDIPTGPNQVVPYFYFEGIPGATRNHTWFGVDYYGEFFITKPGEYEFELEADDGSRLEIDGQRLIDLDGTHSRLTESTHISLSVGLHTIHVPYFQSTLALALMLRIKPPGEPMRPFNLIEFAPPKPTL